MVQKTENMTVAEQVKIVIAETTKKLLEIAKQQKMDSGFVIWLGNQALKQELTKYENIQKTILQDFLAKYPNAKTDGGIPYLCPHEINKKWKPKYPDCQMMGDRKQCVKCWNMPVDGE